MGCRFARSAAGIEQSPWTGDFFADPGLDDIDDFGRCWIKARLGLSLEAHSKLFPIPGFLALTK
jgi:hypothetical protein